MLSKEQQVVMLANIHVDIIQWRKVGTSEWQSSQLFILHVEKAVIFTGVHDSFSESWICPGSPD
jgi:hypothetical protein